MAKIINRPSTNTTNQVGVGLILWLGSSLPNEPQQIDPASLCLNVGFEEIAKLNPPTTSFEKFNTPSNPNISLTSEQLTESPQNEEQVILAFGAKLLGNSRDIEPEIGQIIHKRFWDMV